MLLAQFIAQNKPGQLLYNQSIDISDLSNFHSIDNTVFHWYTPEYKGGWLQNLDEHNNPRPRFNLTQATNKSLLLYTNKIRNCAMGLSLLDEQWRSALWKGSLFSADEQHSEVVWPNHKMYKHWITCCYQCETIYAI